MRQNLPDISVHCWIPELGRVLNIEWYSGHIRWMSEQIPCKLSSFHLLLNQKLRYPITLWERSAYEKFSLLILWSLTSCNSNPVTFCWRKQTCLLSHTPPHSALSHYNAFPIHTYITFRLYLSLCKMQGWLQTAKKFTANFCCKLLWLFHVYVKNWWDTYLNSIKELVLETLGFINACFSMFYTETSEGWGSAWISSILRYFP